MALQEYPGVVGAVDDRSQIVRGISLVPVAVVGEAARGPVGVPTLSTQTDEFTDLHGFPHPRYGYAGYMAICALENNRQVYFVRVANNARHAGLVVASAVSGRGARALAAAPVTIDEAGGPTAVVAVDEEVIGEGDAVETTFVKTLLEKPVAAIDRISVAGTPLQNLIVDLNAGTVRAAELATTGSTIDGTTSALRLVFAAAPAEDAEITIGYRATTTSVLFYIYAADPGLWNDAVSVAIANPDLDRLTFDLLVYETVGGIRLLRDRHTVSRRHQTNLRNEQLYLEDAVNGRSRFIKVVDVTTVADDVMPAATDGPVGLRGGSDGDAVTSADIVEGWREFEDDQLFDVRYLMDGGYCGSTDATVQVVIHQLALARRDCLPLFTTPYSECDMRPTPKATLWRRTVQNINSFRGALYTGWAEVYDSYNRRDTLIPLTGFAAQVHVRTFAEYDAWVAPAGMDRGYFGSTVLPVRRLTHSYSKGQQELLHAAGVNYALTFPGEGTRFFSQKTLQAEASALDHIDVAMLVIVMEISAKKYLKYKLHEKNVPRVRLEIREALTVEFKRVQAREGIAVFKIICDESNNGPEIVSRNQLRVYARYEPTYSTDVIEFLQIVEAAGALTTTTLNGVAV